MKRPLLCLIPILTLAMASPPQPMLASPATAMRVTVLPPSGPHTITAKTLVTFHLRITGLVLDPRHVGKAPVAGHGHIQIYLDRIPADAARRMDMKGIVTVVAAPSFSVGFTRAWIKLHAGNHHFLIALAKNDDVLYSAKPASFAVVVK